MSASIEYRGITREDYGTMRGGSIQLNSSNVKFQNQATGKVFTLGADDIQEVYWIRMGNANALKVVAKDGGLHRFAGFPDDQFNKVQSFVKNHWKKDMEKQEHSIKGWNYGAAAIDGQTMVFRVDNKIAFEVPLMNVSQCPTGAGKSEIIMEFHPNEDAPVQLSEMRLHKPAAGEDGDAEEMVEQFRQAVMRYVEGETDLPIVTLKEILCATPRGRYDIKVYANRLAFHGKSYDYKIPFNTISRMFLLPHKDQRHVFFVISIQPPIRQGQTRYPFIVLECLADDEASLELTGNDQQLERLCTDRENRIIQGRLFEILSKIFRILTNVLITVPHNMVRPTNDEPMTCTVFTCAFRQASGYLYPLEKGFMYVHKPPMYIRFDEIDNVHFARSDASTRSFDFEIVQRSGAAITFSSIGKEEYNTLFDFVTTKGLKVRNAKRLDQKKYREDAFAGSDDEVDRYKEKMKESALSDDEDEDSEEDEDFDVNKAMKKQKADANSSEGSGSEPEEEYDSSGSEVTDDEMMGEKKKPEKKQKKERKKQKDADGEGKKKRKGKRDENMPKRAKTAYIAWMSAERSKIAEPGMSVADVARKGGELWKKMSDSEKEPYVKIAEKDKERYDREMKEYKASGGASKPSKSSSVKSIKKSSAKVADTSVSASKNKSREFIEDSSDSDADSDEKSAPKKKPKVTAQPPSEKSDEDESEEESEAKSTESEEDSD